MNIVYTGARSGIASKVIDKLCKTNHTVYVTVKTELQLRRIRDKYRNYPNIQCLKLDITDENDRKKAAQLPIDVLVCNAAIGYGGSISEMPMAKVRDNFETNVFSNFEFIQLVLNQMIERKKGRVIIMGSLAGILPLPFLGSYCATKASIIKLTECLKLELRQLDADIDICLIEPGLYHTGFNQVMFENKYDDMKDGYFKAELAAIHKRETLFYRLLEAEQFDSIVNKIYKAITCKHPKFLYRAPFYQVIGAKLYQIFIA